MSLLPLPCALCAVPAQAPPSTCLGIPSQCLWQHCKLLGSCLACQQPATSSPSNQQRHKQWQQQQQLVVSQQPTCSEKEEQLLWRTASAPQGV